MTLSNIYVMVEKSNLVEFQILPVETPIKFSTKFTPNWTFCHGIYTIYIPGDIRKALPIMFYTTEAIYWHGYKTKEK